MFLIKIALLLIFLISPLKADAIYNLIKIPNLKIYEIKTKNKLKYFSATKPFRLGVKKNIRCFNSNEETLKSKYKIIYKNLNRYSHEFLKKINLKYIVLCENLSISEINTAGIPDSEMKTLILDIKFNEKYFERVIHHEVFHIINDTYKSIFNVSKWSKYNKKNFKYADCSTCTELINLSLYKKTSGFFTEYSKSIPSEDMAEVFSHLMTLDSEKIKKIGSDDPSLNKKISYIKKNILIIDQNFKFSKTIKDDKKN